MRVEPQTEQQKFEELSANEQDELAAALAELERRSRPEQARMKR